MKPANKEPFRALLRKLSAGKTLAVAASEAGMSEQDARDYLKTRDSEEDQSLRAFCDDGLRLVMKVFRRAVNEKNRKVMHTEVIAEGEHSTTTTHKEAVIDLPAATALLKACMEGKKMLRTSREAGGGGSGRGERDLFDANESNPWVFKKSD